MKQQDEKPKQLARRDPRRRFRLLNEVPDDELGFIGSIAGDYTVAAMRKARPDPIWKTAAQEAAFYDTIDAKLNVDGADPFYHSLLSRLATEEPDIADALTLAESPDYAKVREHVPSALYAAFIRLYSSNPDTYRTASKVDEYVHQLLEMMPEFAQLRESTKRDLFATSCAFSKVWRPIMEQLKSAVKPKSQPGDGKPDGKPEGKGKGKQDGDEEGQNGGEPDAGDGKAPGDATGKGKGDDNGKPKEGDDQPELKDPAPSQALSDAMKQAKESAEVANQVRDAGTAAGHGMERKEIQLPSELIRRIAQANAGNPALARLMKTVAEIVGRFQSSAISFMTKNGHAEARPIGMTIGNDVARMDPLEFIKKRHSPALFRKDFAEGALSQFIIKGSSRMGRGPVIILADESGSMTEGSAEIANSKDGLHNGKLKCTKDTWVRALVQSLSKVCRQQQRPLLYFPFTEGIEPGMRAEEAGPRTAFINGGTNITRSLIEMIGLIWPETLSDPLLKDLVSERHRQYSLTPERLNKLRDGMSRESRREMERCRDGGDIILITDDNCGVSFGTLYGSVTTARSMLAGLLKRRGTRLMGIRLAGNALVDPHEVNGSGKRVIDLDRDRDRNSANQLIRIIEQEMGNPQQCYHEHPAGFAALSKEPTHFRRLESAKALADKFKKTPSLLSMLTDRALQIYGSPLHQEDLEGAVHRFLFSGGTR